MSEQQKRWIKFRLIITFFLFVFLLTVVAVRAYQLQVLKQTELVRLAERQRKQTIKLRPSRGVIVDRKGHELAVSLEVDSVYAHPGQMTEATLTAQRLGAILKQESKALSEKLRSRSSFVWIERGIPPGEGDRVRELGLPGIHLIQENKRFYPNCESGGQLLGFVGIDGNGLEGLERKFESYLTGGSGYLLVEKDALGHQIISSDVIPLEAPRGHNLVLTVDFKVQHIAEKELQKAVAFNHARGGMAIVMDPQTGEILGLALQPSFNPNSFRTSSPDIWRNRAITDSFDPGSTFKVFIAATAIEEGLVSPEEIIYCENGAYRIGKRTIRDVHKYENLSFAEVIKYSSNIGSVKVGDRIPAPLLYEYIRRFGFGEKTGADLPAEASGLVRPFQKWKAIDKSTVCFGQGISVTALQLINGLCAIANGGYLMRPYVVKGIVSEDGKYLRKTGPSVLRRVISKETADVVTEMMRKVVSEDGTGTKAQITGFEIAGKTGTAQKVDHATRSFSNSKFMGSFMGFVPAENPRIAVLVIIDEPKGRGFGGTVAAPAFKAIAEQTLSYLKVFPRRDALTSVAAPGNPFPKTPFAQELTEKDDRSRCADCLPDFTGLSMRKVLQMVRDFNLTLHVEGSGRAVSQRPAAGIPLATISECWVTFRPVT